MRPLLVALACALVGVAGATAPPVAASDAPAECVEYHEVSHPESHTYDLRLTNDCTRARSCAVSWTVTCGKTTKAEHAAALLAASEDRTWVASAQGCEDDWAIDAKWRCAPAR